LEKLSLVKITFVVNEGAFLGEIFRSAIEAVPYQQTEAGYSVGLNRMQTFIRIVLPQAIRVALPAYGADIISILLKYAFNRAFRWWWRSLYIILFS
jgi:L-cystine transport system permease protein